jgi:endonuclease/exonuclease/phosphatase family metal-dependent hydrolase
VPDGRWSEAGFDRLAQYARELDADVIALQEVDGAEAARRLLPRHGFCFTRRAHVQNVGFAIRPGLAFRCNPDLRALGLDGDVLRWGADVTLLPGTRAELRLLGVHLKSGCAGDPLNSDADACRQLARQVPILERWIDARSREGRAFVVTGDFNRLFSREPRAARNARGRLQAMWPELDDGDPPEADLAYASAGERARGCTRRDRHRDFIDHIVLSRAATRVVRPGSFRQHPYADGSASRRVPDHCAISVDLDWPAPAR